MKKKEAKLSTMHFQVFPILPQTLNFNEKNGL
jgi:hypothetical protein